MASITIRNLEDGLKRHVRVRAAEHSRSMEEEVREILRQAVSPSMSSGNHGATIHERFTALSGVDLDLQPREAMPKPPGFG